MPCKFDKEIIIKYALGKAEQLECIFVEEHIKSCSVCYSIYNENKINDGLLKKFSIETSKKFSDIVEKRVKGNKYGQAIILFGEIFALTAGKPLSNFLIKKAIKVAKKKIADRKKTGGST